MKQATASPRKGSEEESLHKEPDCAETMLNKYTTSGHFVGLPYVVTGRTPYHLSHHFKG